MYICGLMIHGIGRGSSDWINFLIRSVRLVLFDKYRPYITIIKVCRGNERMSVASEPLNVVLIAIYEL